MSSRIIRSSQFILLGSIVSKCITFAGSVMLARLLFPKDYGYLTFTTVFTSFLQQIGNFGIEVFYLQEKMDSEVEAEAILQTVFKLRLFTNAALFLLQNLAALGCYLFMKEPITAQLLLIFSTTYILETISSVNGAMLKKEMNFKPIAISNTLRDIVSVVSRVVFASAGFGPLCFGIGAVLGSLCQSAYIARVKPMRVRWSFWDKECARRVYAFSKHVVIGSIGTYGTQQIDKLLMVSFFDVSKIGFYSFGYSNASIPFTYIFSPQQQLILSYCANIRNEPAKLLERMSEITRVILLVMGPLHVLAYFNCSAIIGFVFGEKWLPAADFTRIFILYFFFLSIMTPFNGLLTALGRPDIVGRIAIGKTLFLIPFLCLFAMGVPNLLLYCLSFTLISIAFDLLKAHEGLRMIGGSVGSVCRRNLDLFLHIAAFCCLDILFSKFLQPASWAHVAIDLVLVGCFWLRFWLIGPDRQRIKELIKRN